MKKFIGIFDSGFGGLSIFKALKKKIKVNVIYFGDNKNAPYGLRSSREIKKLFFKALDFFKKKKVELLVIACNSVSAVFKKSEDKEIKIFEIITPSVDKLIKSTKSKRVAVLATKATVKTGTYRKAILKKDPKIKVFSFSCPFLASFIEKDEKRDVLEKIIQKHAKKVIKKKVDTILLGCTHYILIKNIFKKVFKGIKIVDPSKAIVDSFIKFLKIEKNPKEIFYTSGDLKKFKKIGEHFLEEKMPPILKIKEEKNGKKAFIN